MPETVGRRSTRGPGRRSSRPDRRRHRYGTSAAQPGHRSCTPTDGALPHPHCRSGPATTNTAWNAAVAIIQSGLRSAHAVRVTVIVTTITILCDEIRITFQALLGVRPSARSGGEADRAGGLLLFSRPISHPGDAVGHNHLYSCIGRRTAAQGGAWPIWWGTTTEPARAPSWQYFGGPLARCRTWREPSCEDDVDGVALAACMVVELPSFRLSGARRRRVLRFADAAGRVHADEDPKWLDLFTGAPWLTPCAYLMTTEYREDQSSAYDNPSSSGSVIAPSRNPVLIQLPCGSREVTAPRLARSGVSCPYLNEGLS